MNPDNTSYLLELVKDTPNLSSKQLHERMAEKVSYATLKRLLSKLLNEKLILAVGKGKGTKYLIAPSYDLFYSLNPEKYFEKEVDERKIKAVFNFDLIRQLKDIDLFSSEEKLKLTSLHQKFTENISQLSPADYKQEFERLAIDLSWKSSQIEGNTYSLLETELLLREKQTAKGKTKDEAVMLLNHKEAIDFINEKSGYIHPLNIAKIENIHSILIQDLGINRNIRRRKVGISGTNYQPIDNEFQITEQLDEMCKIINLKENIFEKALLVLLLISYIQPFSDGNKRTARILSNAILIKNNHCPLSFRTVDSLDYKKAMLIFYEQNNLTEFKRIFIQQYEFAVNSYF